MSFIKTVMYKISTVKELMHFFWQEKMWWLIPLIIVLIIVAVLLVFAQASPLAPFLYTIF